MRLVRPSSRGGGKWSPGDSLTSPPKRSTSASPGSKSRSAARRVIHSGALTGRSLSRRGGWSLGGQVRSHSGQAVRVAAILPRPGPERVYNLEVQGEHVYEVSGVGVLVHNECALQPYGGPGGGHHVFAKEAFDGLKGFDKNATLYISEEMKRRGVNHLGPLADGGITQTQRKLFTDLARSGRPNTLAEHARIARESLTAGGMSATDADSVVSRALKQLEDWGITAPSKIPWN